MRYDKNRFKIWALPHPLILLWVLNPAGIFCELILGQRLPKVTLIDKESDKPQAERCYVPCPHCETLNDRRLWAKGNDGIGSGHWFGLVCPSCHQIIPCLWNIFSLAILTVTFPLWYFPVRFFRHRWLEKEKERLTKGLERPLIQAKSMINWLLIGAFYWGGSMWVLSTIVEVVWEVLNGREWDLRTMFYTLLPSLVLGSVWGSYRYVCEKKEERVTNVLERHLIRAKSINWFLRGPFYFGGFLWVAFGILPGMWEVLNGREWDLRMMFNTLPFCLLGGFIWGLFLHVVMSLKVRKT